MRIAMVGPFGFHPNKTMRSRALNLARPLVQRGHHVCIFMPPWQTPDEADKRWPEDGVDVRYVPLRGGMVGITWKLIRETLNWRPDVVHCFKPKAYSGLVAWWLWRFHRRRLRLVMDTDDWEGWGGWNELAPYTSWQKRFFAWQEQWGMRHCHALTVTSRALQSIAWSMGIPPQQVVYVPNGPGIRLSGDGVSPGNGVSKARQPTLLLYSRLFEFDTERLVAILRGVKTAVPTLNILAIGAGLYEADAAQFRRQLTAAGLLDSFDDRGWVEEADLPGLLCQADAGIYLMEDTLLNRTKGTMKLVDMLSVGVPVVAEAVGQVPEYVIHGRTGILCQVGDVAGVTADLIRLLQNQAERQRLSAGAKDHIDRHFRWEQLAQKVEHAYET